MEVIDAFHLDLNKCLDELSEFKDLLIKNVELTENEDILPFFRDHLHLSAFIASYSPHIARFDRIKHEFSLLGEFKADLVVGDSVNANYCFIEFEDAKEDSIFKKKGRKTKEWSPRFEHGYSQLVDWFWLIDDFRRTSAFNGVFGTGSLSITGMLIIGRRSFLNSQENDRLRWRLDKNLIDSNKIICLTFDQLADDLESRLEYMLTGFQRI
jgi:hypothetical protein